MESSIEAIVSESPKSAEEEAKNEKKIIINGGEGDGNMIKNNNTQAVIVAVVAAATDHNLAKVASPIISPAKLDSTKDLEKMKDKKNNSKKKRIQVSNNKKPFIFYLNLAKRYINECNDVELCGLGMAIPTVVTIAEILKRNGIAIQKGIMTSTVLSAEEDKKGRFIEKAKIEILLAKAEKSDTTNAAVTPGKAPHQMA